MLIPDWAAALLASSVFGSIAGWLSARVAKRLDAKVDARHAADLEAMRAKAAEQIQRMSELGTKLESRFSVAASFESAAYAVTFPRRADAAEKLWRIAISTADQVMTPLNFFDVVSEAEYPAAREHSDSKFPKAKDLNEALQHVAAVFARERVEELRSLVSEELWQRFSAHRHFFMRVYLVALMPDSRLVPWYRDSTASGMLTAALGRTFVTLGGARTALEQALLAEIRRLMDGELASTRALERGQAIDDAVRKAHLASVPNA